MKTTTQITAALCALFLSVSPASPAQIISISQTTNRAMQLVVQGGTNFTYTMQAAPALDGPWTAISTNTADSMGRFTYTDTTATNASQRFYRCVSPLVWVDDISGLASGDFILGTGEEMNFYVSGGHRAILRAYAYKNVPGSGPDNRVYSVEYAEGIVDDSVNGTPMVYCIVWQWNPVPGADGYRILRGGSVELYGDQTGWGIDYDFNYGQDIPVSALADPSAPSFLDVNGAWENGITNVEPNLIFAP